LLDHQNNYAERLNVDDKSAKNFNIPAITLNVLLKRIILIKTKLSSDLYVAKFLTKSFFLYPSVHLLSYFFIIIIYK